MRATRLVVLLSSIVALGSGCRTVNVSSDYRLDPAKNLGLAVVSLTMAGLPSSYNMFVNYRGLDVDRKSAVAISDLLSSSDWRCPVLGRPTDDNPCGRLVVIELSPGEYEFYSWRGESGSGSMTFTVKSVEDFSKRFKVLSGKAIYLGNIHFSIRGGRYDMLITDRRDRDLNLLHSKHPSIGPDQVVISVLD